MERETMNPRRWLCILLPLLTLWVTNLDAHYYGGYVWTISQRPPLVPTWKAVSVPEVRQKCQNAYANACAVYDVRGGVCTIYASQSEQETPVWLRWHELLHCAGWDHDPEPSVGQVIFTH